MRSPPIFLADFTDLMEEIGVAPSMIRVYSDKIWMVGAIKDWGKLLRSIGIDDDDEVLANHLQRWMNGNFEVLPSGGVRFLIDGDMPLPKAGTEEEFRYGTGDEIRDAALIATLSRYDPQRLKASIIEAIDNRVKFFLEMKGVSNGLE